MIKTQKPQPKLLLVDDSPLDLATLAAILTEYRLFTATEGLQALLVASQEQPDLILLDIGMPGINGYEICQQLKQQATIQHARALTRTPCIAANDTGKLDFSNFD